jgi:hypothetical protein
LDSGQSIDGGFVPPELIAFGKFFREALGVSDAHASGVSPYPVEISGGCHVLNPPKVNHFTLFDQIPNVQWKGCVEARPEPYDVTDDEPSAGNPSTLFVPYFWIDDRDNSSDSYNDYIDDEPFYAGSDAQGRGDGRTYSVYKYDGRPISKDESAPDTRGPNQACPTPIQPLTQTRGQVISAIAQMEHWFGGGTNNAEGVMWGWRVLSPGAPFTQGAPYGPGTRKFMVLMSDGKNAIVPNPNPYLESDANAYGYLKLWRDVGYRNAAPPSAQLNLSSFDDFQDHINSRMQLACTNAKAAGITIYTVLFDEPDAETRAIFTSCATDPEKSFNASSQAELRRTFSTIANDIGKLRLSR